MKIIARVLLVGVSLPIGSCSIQKDSTPQDCAPQYVWLTASSLAAPNVPSMRYAIVTARETAAGTWVWQWHAHNSETVPSPQTLSVEQLLSKVAGARTLRPDPLVLFSFARHDIPQLTQLRARIAVAAGCTAGNRPCLEGTPDQLE